MAVHTALAHNVIGSMSDPDDTSISRSGIHVKVARVLYIKYRTV